MKNKYTYDLQSAVWATILCAIGINHNIIVNTTPTASCEGVTVDNINYGVTEEEVKFLPVMMKGVTEEETRI